MRTGGALLLGLLGAVALASCGGQVARGSGDSGADGTPDACTQQGCSGTCRENYHYIYPVIAGCVVCSCAPDDDAETDATVGGDDTAPDETDGAPGDAGYSCRFPFFMDTEPLTPEDVACTTTADCVVTGCGNCCPGGGYVFGVNESSAFMCFPGGCPPPSDECSPGLWSQDCRSATALADVEVACINGECRTFATSSDAGGATPSDAAAPVDANDEKE